MTYSNSGNLNPLPTSDRNKQLEKLSFAAFNMLIVDKFTFRDERTNDSGVDGSLELESNGKSTNLRAQVQLKATDSIETNQDGSISLQVKSANLNYLLNGQSAIYILYVAPRNEFYFAWAQDECKRIEKSNPNWKDQQTITLQFKDILDNDAISLIYERIQKEAQLQRQITDILGAVSNTEHASFSISRETLEITDSKRAKEILVKSGKLIIASGYSRKVRELSKLLDEEASKNPRILLVRAYAEETLGRYQTAIAYLSEAKLNKNKLSEDDQKFLEALSKSCEYLIGKITIEEYFSFLNNDLKYAKGNFAKSYQLNQLYYKYLTTQDPFLLPELLEELTNLLKEILSDTNVSDVFKLYANSVWLELEGMEIATGGSRDLLGHKLKKIKGISSNLEHIYQEYLRRIKDWAFQVENSINEAERLNHKPLLASLKLTSAQVLYQSLISTYSYVQSQHKRKELVFETIYKDKVVEIIESGINRASEAVEIFQQINNLEGEIRAQLLKADFYDFSGNLLEAQKIAKDILPKAEAMDYVNQISRARDLISGNSIKSKLDFLFREKTKKEQVTRSATITDEEIRVYASQRLKLYKLPDEILEVIVREMLTGKTIAIEQLNWCQFIELLENCPYYETPEMTYQTELGLICSCKLFKFKSLFPIIDSEILIRNFKKNYCENCSSRKPLN